MSLLPRLALRTLRLRIVTWQLPPAVGPKQPICMFVSKDGLECTDVANEFTYNTSTRTVDWATCIKHKAFVRPYVEMRGRKRSANTSTIHAIIAAQIAFRNAFTKAKLSSTVVDEMADDIIDTLFSLPTRTVVKYLVREREESLGD